MDEATFKAIASQLRQPQGSEGIKVGEIMNKGNHEMNMLAINALDVQDEETILELGMGNGKFVSEIVEKAHEVKYIGCDFSEQMIEEAKSNNKASLDNGQVTFKLSQANKLPVDDQSIDKVMTVNTIYFWEKPAETLAEFKRILKPNGKLIIGFRPKHEMEQYPMTKYGFNLYAEEDVEKLLSQNGFRSTRIRIEAESDKEFFGIKLKASSITFTAMLS